MWVRYSTTEVEGVAVGRRYVVALAAVGFAGVVGGVVAVATVAVVAAVAAVAVVAAVVASTDRCLASRVCHCSSRTSAMVMTRPRVIVTQASSVVVAVALAADTC